MVEELETRFNNLKKSIGENNKETLDVMVTLANLYVVNKNYDMAENLLKQAFNIQIEIFGENSRDTIYTLDSLGKLFLDKKDFEEAKNYFERAFNYKLHTYNEKEIKEAREELNEFYRVLNN